MDTGFRHTYANVSGRHPCSRRCVRPLHVGSKHPGRHSLTHLPSASLRDPGGVRTRQQRPTQPGTLTHTASQKVIEVIACALCTSVQMVTTNSAPHLRCAATSCDQSNHAHPVQADTRTEEPSSAGRPDHPTTHRWSPIACCATRRQRDSRIQSCGGAGSRHQQTAYRNARLPYRSSETSSPTGRRVVGPYLPSGQPRGITTQGVTFHGRPKARLASSLLHSGAVISAAPNPAARAPSKKFCTAG